MSPLESRIQKLSLRTPGESLDARIAAILSPDTERNPSRNPVVPLLVTKAEEPSRLLKKSETGAGVSWLPVCASLLIGTVTGYWLRPSPADQPGVQSRSASLTTTDEASQAGQGTLANTDESGMRPAAIQNSIDRSERSQIVELPWISPAAAAVVWEQQTGQIFNVVNHVNDRRFDMCRDCHRVGG